MADDIEDPNNSPYDFAYSPNTDRVYLLAFGHIAVVAMMFESRPAFHRFLLKGNETDYLIADKVIQSAEDIFRDKIE